MSFLSMLYRRRRRPAAAAAEPEPARKREVAEGPPPAAKQEEQPVARTRKPSAADPVLVADLCREAGVPTLTARLIVEQLPAEEVRARVQSAAEVRRMFRVAHAAQPRLEADIGEILAAEGVSAATGRAVLDSLQNSLARIEAAERGLIQ